MTEFVEAILAQVIGNLSTALIILIFYFNFLLFESYLRLIVWAILFSQALRQAKKNVISVLKYLSDDEEVTKHGFLTCVFSKSCEIFLYNQLQERRSGKELFLNYGIFLFSLIGAISTWTRVYSWMSFLHFAIGFAMVTLSIIKILDRRIFYYRYFISDEVLVSTLLILGFFITDAARGEATSTASNSPSISAFKYVSKAKAQQVRERKAVQAAKMLAAHTPDQARFRVLAAEGIELSQAIKTLIHDHIMTYAQVQDSRHFRDIFLWQDDKHLDTATRGRSIPPAPRRLEQILAQHDAHLSSFFSDMIHLTAAVNRQDGSSSAQSRSKAAPLASSSTGDSVGMCFPAFVAALTAIDVIPSKHKAKSAEAARNHATPPMAEGGTAATVVFDESRAMRIFLSCLTVSAETDAAPPSTRLLTYAQFIEALLRVALQRNENLICEGRYDYCAGQLLTEPCDCRRQRLEMSYDMQRFDSAVEEALVLVRAYQMNQTRKRAVLKMSSLRAIHRHVETPQ
ncbi:hypothetical protein P43SY_004860 [Pythium insidiosum]|uniref:Uncharacterized protein n=1 Tax=Pythium insidiosum TaxID=114742 RepID=A0AAD5LDI9_PYTIN|nr:hypothetical protein P43SY_004860 [Pythium insidiosum]